MKNTQNFEVKDDQTKGLIVEISISMSDIDTEAQSILDHISRVEKRLLKTRLNFK